MSRPLRIEFADALYHVWLNTLACHIGVLRVRRAGFELILKLRLLQALALTK